MLYANNLNNERILAKPKIKAICPFCNKELISKCGSIKIWHWSHKGNKDCDVWKEGETQWHLNWKSLVDKNNCEIQIEKHRADILINGMVIELQNSSISPLEIKEREDFYKNMIWIFNAKNWNISFRTKDEFISFRWKHPHKSLWFINKPLFFDVNMVFVNNSKLESGGSFITQKPCIFEVKKIYHNLPCGGWGYLSSKEDFIEKWLKKK